MIYQSRNPAVVTCRNIIKNKTLDLRINTNFKHLSNTKLVLNHNSMHLSVI